MAEINYKEKLDKIREFFGFPPAPAAPAAPAQPTAPMQPVNPAAPVAYTLEDGTPIEIPSLQVGQPVTMSGQALPDGDYKLNTGDTIKVTSGVIAEIQPAAPAAPVAPPAPPIPQQMTQEQFDAAIAEHKDAFETKLAAVTEAATAEKTANETALAELKGKFEAVEADNAKNKETITQLFELVEKLTELPKKDPETPARAGFVSAIKNRDQKLQAIGASITKLKAEVNN